MPAARFEWLDIDRQHPEGQRYLISGALNVDFTTHVRLLLDLSRAQLTSGTYPSTAPPRRLHPERHHLRYADSADAVSAYTKVSGSRACAIKKSQTCGD